MSELMSTVAATSTRVTTSPLAPTTRSRGRTPVGSRWGRRDAKLAHLATTAVGRGLSKKELLRLGARADVVTLPAGSSAAIGADRFIYLLVNGCVAVSTADGVTRTMAPGDTIPPSSFLALSEAEILVW